MTRPAFGGNTIATIACPDNRQATLEELEYADLLLHVIDASNPEWQEQARIVDDLIRELGAENIPCIRVYNKSDLAFAFQRDKEGDAVSVSASCRYQ